MTSADAFQMVETLSRTALDYHPVWCGYQENRDREMILGWGVSEKQLDDWVETYRFCGPVPLFSVLEFDPLPDRSELIVAMTFHTRSDRELFGYLLEPQALGIFLGDREFTFNQSLPGFSARSAGLLAEASGISQEELFPLRYTTELRRHDGSRLQGEVEARW